MVNIMILKQQEVLKKLRYGSGAYLVDFNSAVLYKQHV